MSKKIIGIDLGGTSIKFAILTLDGEVQEKWSIKTNILDEGSHIVDDMIESIAHRLKMLELDASEFQGIGMGSPGVVDREKGTVIGAYNLNWKILQPVKEKIESALHIPFFIDNDANVAALGERWKGAGENQPDVVFMTLGTGVGGGIVAEGRLLHGVRGAAGELGHITIDNTRRSHTNSLEFRSIKPKHVQTMSDGLDHFLYNMTSLIQNICFNRPFFLNFTI